MQMEKHRQFLALNFSKDDGVDNWPTVLFITTIVYPLVIIYYLIEQILFFTRFAEYYYSRL